MGKPSDQGVANVVKALRELGRPAAASELVGKPYSHRPYVVAQLMEAERRGLVRGVREVSRGLGRPRVLWEVVDG